MSRHTANAVMSLAMSVQRHIEIQIQGGMRAKRAIHDLVNAGLHQSIGRNDQPPHTVVAHERVDDFRGIMPQGRLAAGQPKISDGWHRPRDLFDLRESHVAGAI